MTSSAAQSLRKVWVRCSGEDGLSLFLVFLFLALFLEPFLDRLPTRPVTSAVLCLVMLSGVASVSRGPTTRVAAGVAACAAIALRWMTHLNPAPGIARASSAASLLFMIMLTGVILLRVFTEHRVTRNVIRGAIAGYLLFGITWSILYTLLDQTVPGSFSMAGVEGADRQERLIYFSFITLTTVGYGDITPAHDISRICAVTEALVGQLYPATLLARLVSLEVSHREREVRAEGETEERHHAQTAALPVQRGGR